MTTLEEDIHIAVVIPCYRVSRHILDVLARIPRCVSSIHVVDDACPESTAALVMSQSRDPRVRVHLNPVNAGVGGAVMKGYAEAIAGGATVIVKLDGDGQMDPTLIPRFVEPILLGEADYTKGNRFFDLENIGRMPKIRIVGNAVLSLFSKLSTGYWDLFDPTNGYTAIHTDVARRLPFNKLSKRFFFESDMLFRLNLLRATVVDIPMEAHYGNESSNLQISGIFWEFLAKHARNFSKRIFYNYFLRDLSIASLQLVLGLLLFGGGVLLGLRYWIASMQLGTYTPPGPVMLSALPVILGLQLILGFLAHDIATVPRRPIHLRRPVTRGLSDRSGPTRPGSDRTPHSS